MAEKASLTSGARDRQETEKRTPCPVPARIKIVPLIFGLVLTLLGIILSGHHMMAEQTKTQEVKILAPWARATPGGVTVGAAYLSIRSESKTGDRLIGVASERAARAELHTHTSEGGVMKMRKVESLAVKPGTALVLGPGGHHIMLFDLKRALKAGEKLPLTLTFEKAGVVAVIANVAPIGADGPTGTSAGKPAAHGSDARGSGAGDHGERGSTSTD